MSILGRLDHIDKWNRVILEVASCQKSGKYELIKKLRSLQYPKIPFDGKMLTMTVDKNVFCYNVEGKKVELYDLIGKNIRIEYYVGTYEGSFGKGCYVKLKNIQALC